MKVVVKKPGQPAYVDTVRSIDKCLSELLGTPARCFSTKGMQAGSLLAWCDDDGISKNLPVNFARPTDGAEIRGPIVITGFGYTKDGPDAVGLSASECCDALDLVGALGIEARQGATP